MIASHDTYRQMPSQYHDKCVYIPENGLDPARFSAANENPIRKPLRIAFIGRLVPYKGADMLIEAAAPLLQSGDAIIDILGDGPEMDPPTKNCSNASANPTSSASQASANSAVASCSKP